MAKPHSAIRKKLDVLHQQAEHYQKAYQDALQKIEVLEQALFILNPLNDNYFLNADGLIVPQDEKKEKYQFRQGIAKIMKQLPYQWISTQDVTLKFMELEHIPYDEFIYDSLRKKIAGALRLLHEKGVLENKSYYGNKVDGKAQSQWRVANFSMTTG